MTEAQALAAAFGGQPVELYGEAELRAQLAANRAAGTVPEAPTTPDILGSIAAQASAEIVGTAWEQAQTTHERLEQLFGDAVVIPDLGEFVKAGVDFARLRSGFEGYKAAGMQPELVLAPINLPLETWYQTYSHLRQWQDQQHPDSACRLQKQSDGDGLYVCDSIANAWNDLNHQAVTQTPGTTVVARDGTIWKALVVPTASREDGGLTVNVSHDLNTGRNNLATQAEATNGLVPETSITETNAHMPIQTYLTLQASHILEDTPLLDSNTHTWAAGHFDYGGRSPAVDWDSGFGQVYVNNVGVGRAGDGIGVRLPVWG